MRRVEILPNGCWRFTGKLMPEGYGRISVGGTRLMLAHRLSFEHFRGITIPDGLPLDHKCHDPKTCPGGKTCPHRACCNPDHLEISSPQENASADRSCPVPRWVILKAHAASVAKAESRTHCKYGHPFTEDNIYRNKRRGTQGIQRKCLKCCRDRARVDSQMRRDAAKNRLALQITGKA